MNTSPVAEALRSSGRPVGDATVLAVHERLVRDAVGAGPLEPLLRLPGVTDVLVNGAGAVHIDRGRGLEQVALDLGGEPEVRRLAQRLAAAGGRRLDDAVPHVDVRLADGTRLHAVLAPVARPGTLISLRVPSAVPLTLDDLIDAGALTSGMASIVRRLIAARVAFLVTGGTGTGKTTLLGSLLGLVPPDERIVVVEDAAELRPAHPHVVGLEGRVANIEGAGALDLRLLVRQALRMALNFLHQPCRAKARVQAQQQGGLDQLGRQGQHPLKGVLGLLGRVLGARTQGQLQTNARAAQIGGNGAVAIHPGVGATDQFLGAVAVVHHKGVRIQRCVAAG